MVNNSIVKIDQQIESDEKNFKGIQDNVDRQIHLLKKISDHLNYLNKFNLWLNEYSSKNNEDSTLNV